MIVAVGGLAHDDYRAFSTERRSHPACGFIDGDLVERLLDLPDPDIRTVIRAFNTELEQIKAIQASTVVKGGGSSIDPSSHTTSAVLTGLSAKPLYSVEEVIRRVEDMSRLH